MILVSAKFFILQANLQVTLQLDKDCVRAEVQWEFHSVIKGYPVTKTSNSIPQHHINKQTYLLTHCQY